MRNLMMPIDDGPPPRPPLTAGLRGARSATSAGPADLHPGDVIVRRGQLIRPREIAEILMTHPDVASAAVVGVHHPSHGQEVKAFVVPARGSAITTGALLAWCRHHIGVDRRPRMVCVVASLPSTSTRTLDGRQWRGSRR